MKYSGIGGQAVIEGIMMKNKNKYAIAVRKPDKTIDVKVESCKAFSDDHKWAKLPIIRGAVNFVDSMIVGMQTLSYSASFFEDDPDTKPSKFEIWLQKMFGDKLDKIIMTASIVFALVLSVVLFMWLPLFIVGLFSEFIPNHFWQALLEGVLRVAIFIAYIKIVSGTEDIKRTFMYHGAEHKCINCVEHGLDLTKENVMKSSKEHKRCGTSFIFIVMIISILFFVVIRVDNVALKFLLRLFLIPVIAGISYEALKFMGTHDSKLVDFFAKPGLLMQGLTTLEPDEDMAEVAIAATEAVFDWRAYLTENFGRVFEEEPAVETEAAAGSEGECDKAESAQESAEAADTEHEADAEHKKKDEHDNSCCGF
ncbi:MAG: DUF1385 domain-containing protein [Eubacteriales bacterium]|nr:DUF1385 domain-containing protein [Eubacteriales bacterium]